MNTAQPTDIAGWCVMTDWQPIETAPKDGTWVLTIIKGYIPSVSHWNACYRKWLIVSPEDHGDETMEILTDGEYNPTHWMPLPAAPGVQAGNIWESDKMREFYAGSVRDAARYRWLRSNERGMANLSCVINDDCQPPYYELKCMKELDAAIDAAMGNAELKRGETTPTKTSDA